MSAPRNTGLLANCAAAVAAALALALLVAGVAQAYTVRVVNERGVPQTKTWVIETVGTPPGPTQSISYLTDAYGEADLPARFGHARFRVTRGGSDEPDCEPAPEGLEGISHTIPYPQPAQVTVTLPNGNGPLPAGEPMLSAEERWIIGQINEERTAGGRGPAEISLTLSELADRYLEHMRVNGLDPSKRIYCQFGDIWTRLVDSGWPFPPGGFGLNGEKLSSRPTAQEAFASWNQPECPDCPNPFSNRYHDTLGIASAPEGAPFRWMLVHADACPATAPAAERCRMTGDFGDPTLLPDFVPDPGEGGGLGEDGAEEPEARIDKHPRRRTTRRRAKFEVSGSEGAELECSLDGVRRDCSSGVVRYRVALGRHRFRVLASSETGRSEPDRFRFRRVRRPDHR